MGIPGLLPFLNRIKRKRHISYYANKKVAVDTYCWLHKGASFYARDFLKGK